MWAHELAGHLRSAQSEAEAALSQARESGDELLIAAASLQLGRVLGRQRSPQARDLLRTAKSLALSRRDHGTAADAAIFLRKYSADVLEDPSAASLDGEMAEELVHAAGGQPLRRADLADATGVQLRVAERFDEASRAHDAAAELFTRVLGPASPDVLRARLGSLNARADSDTAEPAAILAGYTDIIGRLEAVAGPEHPWTLDAYYTAALVAEEQERWAEAQRWATRARQIAVASQGEDSPIALHAALVLARVAFSTQKHELADTWARQALSGLQRLSEPSGVPHTDLRAAFALLADVALARGDVAEAIRAHERAAEVSRANPLLGPERVLEDLYNIAAILSDDEQWAAAGQRLEQALRDAPAEVVAGTLVGVEARNHLEVIRAKLARSSPRAPALNPPR